MSYCGSTALQSALYHVLTTDTVLAALVGSAVYDALPTGTIPDLYVTLGDERGKDASDSTGRATSVEMDISVVSRSGGFQDAKSAASAICDALLLTPMVLSEGHLVGIWVLKTTAKRTGDPEVRRIDLTFKALVQHTL